MIVQGVGKNVVEDRKKREYGSEQGKKKKEWTKGKSILELLKGLFRRLEAILTRRNLKACIH